MSHTKLLILDLDETLVHTEIDNINSEVDYDFKMELDYGCYFTVMRPYLKEFVSYIFDNFKVAIWTASGNRYAEHIVKNIGIDINSLEFFYTESNCNIKLDQDTCDFYGVKLLSKIRKKFKLDDVLIVDDVHLTAQHNYGNLIHIKPFICDKNDKELLKLISYLEKIKNAKDFRNIEKRGWSNDTTTII